MANVLTPERVVELAIICYESGLAAPGHSGWFQRRPNGPPLACLLTAAYLASGQTYTGDGYRPWEEIIRWAEKQGLAIDSLQGLTLGFDFGRCQAPEGLNEQLFSQANFVGLAARKELNPVYIPPEY